MYIIFWYFHIDSQESFLRWISYNFNFKPIPWIMLTPFYTVTAICLYRVSKNLKNANNALHLKPFKNIHACKYALIYKVELISFQIQQTRSKSAAKWTSYSTIVKFNNCRILSSCNTDVNLRLPVYHAFYHFKTVPVVINRLLSLE